MRNTLSFALGLLSGIALVLLVLLAVTWRNRRLVLSLSDPATRDQVVYGGSTEVLLATAGRATDLALADENRAAFDRLRARGDIITVDDVIHLTPAQVATLGGREGMIALVTGGGVPGLRAGTGWIGGQWAPGAFFLRRGDGDQVRWLISEALRTAGR